MNRLLPSLTWAGFRRALGMAVVGAMVAGVFGIVHDQISYTISPEYYDRMKFEQFAYADIGLTGRWFVAQIGFLASWWVGFIAGWFLARVERSGHGWVGYLRSLVWVMAGAVGASALGVVIGPRLLGGSLEWGEALVTIGVTDAEGFNRVAGMHTGTYLGAVIAWVVVLVVRMREGATMK